MIDSLGFLDEDFFLNHEDTDLNLRAFFAGWKCMFVHDAMAHHHVSSSIGATSDTAIYYASRNSLWVLLKNLPYPLIIRYFPHRIVYELASGFAYCVLLQKWRPYLKGKAASLRGVPRMLAKRRDVQKHIVLKQEDLREMLTPLLPYLWGQFRSVRCASRGDRVDRSK
jgi:hypothetical protein